MCSACSDDSDVQQHAAQDLWVKTAPEQELTEEYQLRVHALTVQQPRRAPPNQSLIDDVCDEDEHIDAAVARTVGTDSKLDRQATHHKHIASNVDIGPNVATCTTLLSKQKENQHPPP